MIRLRRARKRANTAGLRASSGVQALGRAGTSLQETQGRGAGWACVDGCLSSSRLSSSTRTENCFGFCSVSILAINSFNRWLASVSTCMALPPDLGAWFFFVVLFVARPSRADWPHVRGGQTGVPRESAGNSLHPRIRHGRTVREYEGRGDEVTRMKCDATAMACLYSFFCRASSAAT